MNSRSNPFPKTTGTKQRGYSFLIRETTVAISGVRTDDWRATNWPYIRTLVKQTIVKKKVERPERTLDIRTKRLGVLTYHDCCKHDIRLLNYRHSRRELFSPFLPSKRGRFPFTHNFTAVSIFTVKIWFWQCLTRGANLSFKSIFYNALSSIVKSRLILILGPTSTKQCLS